MENEKPSVNLSPTYTQEPSKPWPPNQEEWQKATADLALRMQRLDKRAQLLEIIQKTKKRLINQRRELHGLSHAHNRLLEEYEQLEAAGDHLVNTITALQDEVERLQKDNSQLRLMLVKLTAALSGV